jgi:hypothetical protein
MPEQADRVTLYSLECDFDRQAVREDAELLHGYLVLGKTDIESAEDRTEILDAVRKDIANGGSAFYHCFTPHHAVRIVHDDTTTDIVICYMCRGYERTENGELGLSHPMDVRSRDLLNRVLESHDITLSPDAKEELEH